MLKLAAADGPPPGAGFTTVMVAVPATATSEARMDALRVVELTKVVLRLLPFHCTLEVAMKFVPLTVKVKPVPQTVAEEGDREAIVGTGFGGGGLEDVDEPEPPQPDNRHIVKKEINRSEMTMLRSNNRGLSIRRHFIAVLRVQGTVKCRGEISPQLFF